MTRSQSLSSVQVIPHNSLIQKLRAEVKKKVQKDEAKHHHEEMRQRVNLKSNEYDSQLRV